MSFVFVVFADESEISSIEIYYLLCRASIMFLYCMRGCFSSLKYFVGYIIRIMFSSLQRTHCLREAFLSPYWILQRLKNFNDEKQCR